MGALMGWLRHPGTANGHPQRMIKKTATTTSDHAHADADTGAGADVDADAIADANAAAADDDIALLLLVSCPNSNAISDRSRPSSACDQ